MIRWTSCAVAAAAVLVGVTALPAQRRGHHGTLNGWRALVRSACSADQKYGDAADKFGRALPEGTGAATEAQLFALAEAMRESAAADGVMLEDPSVPAGIIFLGQFIDHDVTFDVLSQLGEATDLAAIENFRTPRLDLDSCYRDGPEASPYLYDDHRQGHFLVGSAENPLDLPRNAQGRALIGDPRNDENGIISQLHLLFLRFHNAVMAEVERGRVTRGRRAQESDFDYARRLVRWHYQWIVREEFLPTVVSGEVLRAAEAMIAAHDAYCARPLLPVEFSAAAYRFGHSQVRSTYHLAPGRPAVDLFRPPAEALASFAPVPATDAVDFDFFFAVAESAPQAAQRIDAHIADEVYELPFASHRSPRDRSLPFRNLLRGAKTFNLASGEQAAQFFGVPALSRHAAVNDAELDHTPLWFYCLQEAEANGGKLGPVGGRIVAMAILRMLREDPESYPVRWGGAAAGAPEGGEPVDGDATGRATGSKRPASDRPAWRPFLGRAEGEFTMGDLVQYVRRSR
ncbi:MAG: peroxidase family protein [Planctomycetota bacterium]